MPGFLGGSSGSSGTGGEITFPKEFIDPVTKLRVSQPENLIDTDFEYGLQPTKWETVELINNTPSFFSKSGDTTIPGIVSISTNNGTREITVTTATDHNLAVGIPINVTGTKSVTADGSYVINSIPNLITFTYLCKDEQIGNNSIEDLYTSIITGEFFQGSQIRIADSEGITTDAESISTLTVKTDSTHGFGLNTPFYFLNLNSTISQEFEASNTAAKSFDSSNSATAQTFDGSNSLSTFNIDWSNSATVGGVTSTISSVNTTNDTITVAHGAETFASKPLGTPLYYSLTVPASSGYFFTNPRGVVFLKTIDALNTPAGQSTFQVSATPDGTAIDITSSMSGTFQLANQARTFAGNNLNPLTQTDLTIIKETSFPFDGNNQGYVGNVSNGLVTVEGYSGTILVSVTPGAGLNYFVGSMVRYSTTGSAASGLTNNRTYFIRTVTPNATPNFYNITIHEYPNSASALAPTGGSGTQTFQAIGVSTDKDIIHIPNSNFATSDMIEYTFPEGQRFTTSSEDESKIFYFVQTAYDAHNYEVVAQLNQFITATGGVVSEITENGRTYKLHQFTTVGANTFTVTGVGPVENTVEYVIVGGGGGGGASQTVATTNAWTGGGGGAGGMLVGSFTATAVAYTVTVGGGGAGAVNNVDNYGAKGGNSTIAGSGLTTLTAFGGGGGQTFGATVVGGQTTAGANGGSGGGMSSYSEGAANGTGVAGQGNAGGAGLNTGGREGAGGGGGAGQAGLNGASNRAGKGGDGRDTWITGTRQTFAGGGGGGVRVNIGVARGQAGLGGGGLGNQGTQAPSSIMPGLNATANTGGGGGGAGDNAGNEGDRQTGGAGGSGIVILRYPTTPAVPNTLINASGGDLTTIITIGGINYRVHAFTTPGSHSLVVSSVPAGATADILLVAGGGAGGTGYGDQDTGKGGGGAGGVLLQTGVTLTPQTYSLYVGRGGRGWSRRFNTTPDLSENGENTTGFGLTAVGGGGGGASDNNFGPRSGGSGGGGGGRNGNTSLLTGASGTASQGNAGGNGTNSGPGGGMGGGGGGAGAAGSNASSGPAGANGGIGRDLSGTFTTRFGDNGYFGGGGGGGAYNSAGQPLPAQTPRSLGGGGRSNAATDSSSSPATQFSALDMDGLPTTGGGGGGASEDGQGVGFREPGGSTSGSGGSGIILVRYRIS